MTRWTGECLAIWPSKEWTALNVDIAKRPRTDPAATRFRHFLLGSAHEADLDAQGRVTVPAHLRKFARLEGDAVVVGISDHLEVWEPARWRANLASVQSQVTSDLKDLGV